MPRNTEGLKRSARLRSESAMQRALAALQRMDASDREINFRTVAAEAAGLDGMVVQPGRTACAYRAFPHDCGPSGPRNRFPTRSPASFQTEYRGDAAAPD